MKYDAIIIGSGLGGLECAAMLAKAGLSVVVLEQASAMGGCLQSFRRSGMTFDTGFHCVGALGVGQSLYGPFKHLGLMNLSWRRMDACFDHIAIGPNRFVAVEGFDTYRDYLAERFPDERKALHSYFILLRRATREHFNLLNPNAKSSINVLDSCQASAWQYLTVSFRNPLLINALSADAFKTELNKATLPLFSFLHSHSSFIESSWRLKGDGSLIIRALVNLIQSCGGIVRTNASVVELQVKDGKIIRAVCHNGEAFDADIFISNIHPAGTCALIKDTHALRKSFRRRISALANTSGMFTVSLRLKPNTLKYFNYNQYVFRRPNVWTFQNDGAVSGVMASCRVPEDDSPYARQIDLLAPMSWNNCTRWLGTKPGNRGDDYLAMKNKKADECIELAQTVIPGLREAIDTYYTSTPLTWHDYLRAPQGTAFGVRKDFNDPLGTVLSVRTPIPNLLLTGQNLMLHGLHGVTMTALFTCAEILGKDYIWEILN